MPTHAEQRVLAYTPDQLLHQPRLEFEIDIEIDAAAARHLVEHPTVVEAPEWSLGIGDVDAPRRIERNARGETLAKHAEADDHVGDDPVGPTFLDARREAPRQKLGIALDIGNQRKELLWRVGQHTLFGMGRHRRGLAGGAELGPARRAQQREILPGVVRGARQRRGRDQ